MTSRTTRSNRQPATTSEQLAPNGQENLVSTGRRPQLIKRLTEHLRSSGSATTSATADPNPSDEDNSSSAEENSGSASAADEDTRTTDGSSAAEENSPREADNSSATDEHASASEDEEHDILSQGSDSSPDSSVSDSDRLWRRRRTPEHRESRSRRTTGSRHRTAGSQQRSSRNGNHPSSSSRSADASAARKSRRHKNYHSLSHGPRYRSRSPVTNRRRSPSYSPSPVAHRRRSSDHSPAPRRHHHRHRRSPSPHPRNGHRTRARRHSHHTGRHSHGFRDHSRTQHHSRRSVHSRLGPTPSPPAVSTSNSDTEDEPPPSACGQPLPLSILRRIRRGEFVNLSLLLPHPPHLDPDHKNSRLSVATMEALRYHFPQPQQQQQRRPVHQQITNLESWLRAWSRYLHATVHYFPRKAVQMIAYQDTIISAAERYQFDGLYSYDRAFWAKLAHDPTTRWDTVDDQLWSIWCSTQARPFCSRCHKFGHSVAACPAAARTFRPYQPGQSPRTKDGRIIFLQFNTSSCPNPAKCKFAHVCLKCEGDHAQSSTACGRT